MTGNEFIFSEKPGIRIARHMAFWIICFLYLMYFMYHGGISLWSFQKSVLFKGSELSLLFLIIIPFTYWVIYFLVPRYFLTRQVLLFIVYSLMGLLIVELLLYLNYRLIMARIHPAFFGFPTNIMHENEAKYLLSPLIARIFPITGMAITLKYLKVTWQEQNEIENLEKAKLSSDLKLLKSQVSTDFLFSSLDSISILSENASPEAPRKVLHLSELLRYLVYEAGGSGVPLSKELEMIRNYVSIMSDSREHHTDCSLQINGDPKNLVIEPMLLLSVIQASFKASGYYSGEKHWISIDLKIMETTLYLKINYNSSEEHQKPDLLKSEIFEVIFKRLEQYYPEMHDMKHIEDNDISMISLRLTLQVSANTPVKKNSPDAK